MELALYCPDCGYYEKEKDTVGRRGDFYTSVSIGKLFGELLAFQFTEWLKDWRSADCRLQIVEAGAHDGRLANDILSWLMLRRPVLWGQIEYCIVEPSVRLQTRQKETLAQFGSKVRWFGGLEALATHKVRGVIFSNELLDAMPVNRIGWDGARREWFEWGVAWQGNRFVWTRLFGGINAPDADTWIITIPENVPMELLDGLTVETSSAGTWWRQAAGSLERGKLLTLDYGLDAGAFLSRQLAGGTLRAYHRHHLVEDVLANPGEQDLTAHVDFTLLKMIGERAGLNTEVNCSQAEFLTHILKCAGQVGNDFESWTGAHTRQFLTLTHPEHLGRSFRVLVQSRNGGQTGIC